MCSVKISNDNNNNNKNDDDDNNNNNNNRDNNLIDTSRIIRIEECVIGGHWCIIDQTVTTPENNDLRLNEEKLSCCTWGTHFSRILT